MKENNIDAQGMWIEKDVIAKWIRWTKSQFVREYQTLQGEDQDMAWPTHTGQALGTMSSIIAVQFYYKTF